MGRYSTIGHSCINCSAGSANVGMPQLMASVTPRRLPRRWVIAGMLLGAGGLIAAACNQPGVSSVAPTPRAGAGLDATRFPTGEARLAPDFTLVVYQGEAELGARELLFSQIIAKGRPVVLNFWAGQCPPCRREMPDLQSVYAARRDRILLVGVDIGPFVGLGSREDGEALVRELGVTYPVGTTFDAGVVQAYRVLGMPTTVFITRDGRIIRQWTGLLTHDALTQLVDELLAVSGPPPA